MRYGLIGEKLGHSFSKPIHEQLADYTYDLIPLNPGEFREFMEQKQFKAINVTIPYKEAVMEYCDYIDDKAKNIGAVNAIKNINGKLYATNTDFDGLKMMIQNHFDISGRIVAICGSGGTSKTAFAVAKDLCAKEIVRVGRNKAQPFISYEQLKSRKDVEIIINTTSVGMLPDIMGSIVNLDDHPGCIGVIDVVYNPLLTSLCYEAKQRNIPYICGIEMLVGQAVKAVEFFTDSEIDKAVTGQITDKMNKSKRNLVLIGMPSCGKTSLGKAVAKRSGMDFVDIDREIEKAAGKTIPDIFAEGGEALFRKLEAEMTLEISKRNHTVISCGGGVVKNAGNMKALALNGLVVYIDRDLSKLQSGGSRPLSSDMEAIKKLKTEREPLYKKYSDIIIKNNGGYYAAVDKLMEVYRENFGD